MAKVIDFDYKDNRVEVRICLTSKDPYGDIDGNISNDDLTMIKSLDYATFKTFISKLQEDINYYNTNIKDKK